MDFEERRWLMANPFIWIAPVALGLAGFAAFRDEGGWFPVALMTGFAFALMTGAMTTRVHEQGVLVTYRPFWRRRVQFSEIQGARLIEYQWTKFGGWGIRFGDRAVAYSVWEKQAVRLQLEGRDVVIGTRRGTEFLDALRANGVSVVDTTDGAPS